MDSEILSNVKIEEPEVYLDHPDVHSSAEETLTEVKICDKMDSRIPAIVKPEVCLEYSGKD